MTGLDIDYHKDKHEFVKHTHLTLSFRFDDHFSKHKALEIASNYLDTVLKISRLNR